MTQPQQPIKEFRVTPSTAAVWKNELEVEGRTVVRHNVKLQKRYLDRRSGSYKTTDCLFPADLPKLILAAQKAYEFVALLETECESTE